ncbi:hypothetical protein L1987_74068 [Smallanthus sonchifolius]|uniref:Uncharacterized protein n=1 Tax=Smallanthus sonchifolius TaxID=185202 RepID=A0ACB9A211_9ASTR|nr:hypothetical protein L1987_74068 [Smallanthus sonchifolius]
MMNFVGVRVINWVFCDMGSSGFFTICLIYSVVALSCGTLMMFYSHEVFAFCHGNEIAVKLLGSTPHDQLLIETSDSFSGLLLFAVGIMLFMVAFVKDRDFQSFFAKRVGASARCDGDLEDLF